MHTIYPPLAEAWFALVHRLGGIDARHKSWQVAGALVDLALIALLAAALRQRGRDPRWVALYALSPLPVVEVVANGHVDGLATLLLVAALAVATSPGQCAARPHGASRAAARMGRGRTGVGAAGVLVAAATLVKLYPVVAMVGLVGAGPPAARRGPTLLRAGLGLVPVLAFAYLPHVLAVGSGVLGYLPGYLREERYDEGSRFLLVSLLAPSPAAARAGAVVVLGGLAGWVLYRRPEPAAAVALLLGGLLLVSTPVQPWYAVGLLAVSTLAARPAWAVVAVAGYPYFFAVILDHPEAPEIGRWCWGGALAALAATAAIRAVVGRPGATAESPRSARPGDEPEPGAAGGQCPYPIGPGGLSRPV